MPAIRTQGVLLQKLFEQMDHLELIQLVTLRY